MARKGNQQKNGVDHHTLNHKRRGSGSGCNPPDTKGRGKAHEVKVFPGEELPNGNQPGNFAESVSQTNYAGDENRSSQKSENLLRKEKQGMDALQQPEQPISSRDDLRNCNGNIEASTKQENATLYGTNQDNSVVRSMRASTLSILKASSEWLERQRPLFMNLTTKISNACDHARMKIEQAYPVVLKWLMQVGSIMLLISMVWLDCALRGMDSFLRMGTTSFFSVIWFSIFSVIAMVGILKFLVVLALAVLIGVFVGFTLAILVVAISGTVFLWFYGSFWTTAFVIFLGGLAFMLSHERIALLITTVYSIYCAWAYVGWLGLLIAHASTSETGPGLSADRGPGVPSTSGTDSELTSEEEVVRLLNCTDHYLVLGLSRYEDIDVSVLKREYRKKAMLVHPDKNMGNEKAVEAFKKLQNAYEVLLDTQKRKTYDDELRREELLNLFRRFQSTSQMNGGHGLSASGFAHSEAGGEDPLGDSRRIACKKCGNHHVWVHTRKSKSQARWCQECKDFHQAKDGDGWVEQSSQPFLFGLLQKVDAPSAFVCADSRIYDATEWYICQGMRCPANTHKPSFHVNTSVTSKHNSGKGTSSGQRGGRMPQFNMEETMTEEEFFEWLQNAVQTGMFDNSSASTSTESPPGRTGNGTKSGGSSNGASANKRKKKGKKQW
nr:dnaj like subfamily c member 14 [Quercus suber]